MSVANTSQHLQTLKGAHLVDVRREGLYAYYRLASSDVFTLWQVVRRVGEAQLAELDRIVETYLSDRDTLEGISIHQLQARLEQGEVLLLDVRPAAEYRAGHIPGARSVPISELAERLDSLPSDQEVVAYCRGPYCVFADEAVALLGEQGYRAARLTEGFPEWQAAGLPVSR
jgi:rhodanese-related sulfurtransferase